MNRRSFCIHAVLFAVAMLISACSSLPTIDRAGSGAAALTASRCEGVFPRGKWQFVHAIEATLPGGGKSVVLGISTISSQSRHVRSLIMTVEGMVLFDAQYDTRLHINRAVPPFDSEDFARGLMEDIRFIFFAPRGPVIASGRLEDGSAVCRHHTVGGGKIDVVLAPPDRWELRRYSSAGRLTGRVRATAVDTLYGQPIPRQLALKARAANGRQYRLNLKLVDAVPR